MEQEKFIVFYQNGLKEGVSIEQAASDLAALLKMDVEKAATVIKATNRVVKKGLSREQAEKYFTALNKIGMKVDIQAENAPQAEETLEQTVVMAPPPFYPIKPKKPADGRVEPTISEKAEPALAMEPKLEPALEMEPKPEPALDMAPKPEPALEVEPKSEPEPEPEVKKTEPEDITYRDIQVEFHGNGLEYFKIWIVNIFLTIITLGIYSAWAKVRNKQYFYGNTEIDRSSFQYTAKPITILKGRLIAVAIFVAFSVVSEFVPIAGLVFALFILGIFPWLVVRSLAFNARNSVYRNIRFNFTANSWDAAKAFLLWPLIIFPTLGLGAPLIWYKQSQFFVNNSAYGTAAFSFHARIRDYFKIFFIALGSLLLVGVVAGGVIVAMFPNIQNNDPTAMMAIAPFSFLFSILIYALLFGYMAASLGNIYFNSSALEQHGFTSTLGSKMMAWLYVSNTVAILLSLGLMIPWARVRMARYRARQLQFHAAGSLDKYIAAEQEHVSALGDQMGEVFDMEVSVI